MQYYDLVLLIKYYSTHYVTLTYKCFKYQKMAAKKSTIDSSQKPTLLSYSCYVRQAMPLAHYTKCSHSEK